MKKVGSEEGRGELALSELGARRGVRGEVNLPLGTEVRKIRRKNGRQDERRKDLHARPEGRRIFIFIHVVGHTV